MTVRDPYARRATAKQIAYGNLLLEELAALTGTEPESLDFELMNSLEATEEITKLEALRALLTALDFDPYTETGDEDLLPQPSAQGRTKADLSEVFRQMVQ